MTNEETTGHLSVAHSKAQPCVGSVADSADEIRARLAAVWDGLVSGRNRITAELSSGERTGLEFTDTRVSNREWRLSARELHVLEEVLISQSQKAAAIDLNLSPGVVCGILHRSFQKIGLDCTYRTAPLLVVLMVLAIRRSVIVPGLRIETKLAESGNVHLISSDRPDARARALLSPAESDVVQMMMDGHTHEHIAHVRRTSRRTIANQVAKIHSKLGASGRIHLISRLSADSTENPLHIAI